LERIKELLKRVQLAVPCDEKEKKREISPGVSCKSNYLQRQKSGYAEDIQKTA
jgi:hypothetical protein